MLDRQHFRRALWDLREQKGITRTELANRVGISSDTLSAYEHGRRMPSFETVVAIADVLGESLDAFAGTTQH